MPDEATPTAENTPAAPATPTPEPAVDIDAIVNERVNAKLANHKRTLQQQLKDAQGKASAYDRLQGQVGELLESGLIDGVEDLDDFRHSVTETLDQYKSETERLADEDKKKSKLLDDAVKRAEEVTTRYNNAMINQGITDEAVDKAVSPGALNLIKQHLSQFAKTADDGTVTFDMPVKNDEGQVEVKSLTPKQAVENMEADVTNFGTLFKSTVSGGAGGEVVDGVFRTQNGDIDFGNMSMEKYLELRDKNPDLVEKTLKNMRL